MDGKFNPVIAYGNFPRMQQPLEREQLKKSILHLSKPNSEILNLQGIILKRDGDFEGALSCMKRAFNSAIPKDYRVAYNIGLISEQMGHHSESITWFKKSLQIYPKFEKAKSKVADY